MIARPAVVEISFAERNGDRLEADETMVSHELTENEIVIMLDLMSGQHARGRVISVEIGLDDERTFYQIQLMSGIEPLD